MRPIWLEQVIPRLRERGAGGEAATRTFRLAGIGESAVAELLGEELLRSGNPVVATYARADAVDVRISARPEPEGAAARSAPGSVPRSAQAIVDATAARVHDLLADHIWAEGATSWADAIGHELESLGLTLACVEVGTGGSFASLLGDREWLKLAETLAPNAPAAVQHADPGDAASAAELSPTDGLEALARSAREVGGSDVSIGVRVRSRGDDSAVTVVVVMPDRVHRERRLAFLGGAQGRLRAALVAAHVLLVELRAGEFAAATAGATSAAAPPG
jgi:nicotinamide-nucleotide amidase